MGEALRQEKVTHPWGIGEGGRSGFSFSLLDKRAGKPESLAREGEGQAEAGNSMAPLSRCCSGQRACPGFYLKHDRHPAKFSAS